MQRTNVWLGVCVAVLLLLSGQQAVAAVNAGVLFLRIAPGARSAAMGEAFVAVANDATATHWNPAGLGTYPLNDDWEEFPLPEYGQVLDAALAKNDLPYSDYRVYDLWILTERGLMVVEPGVSKSKSLVSTVGQSAIVQEGQAGNWIQLSTAGVGSIAAAIRRYAPFLSESHAEDVATRAAAAHVGIDPTTLEPLLQRLDAAMPDEYRDRTQMQNAVSAFRTALREARLDETRVPNLRDALVKLPESGDASTDQLDRALFALQRSVGGQIPDRIGILVNDLFPSGVRAIGGDGDRIYVGTTDGLYVLNGGRWDVVPAPSEDGWSSEAINCIVVTAGNRLWVGTDQGVLSRSGGTWTRLGMAQGLPGERVTAMAISHSRTGWVMTEAGLARFENDLFSGFAELTANVGDDLSSLLGRFIDTEDQTVLARAAQRVREVNGLGADFQPEAGATLQVPYMLGFTNQVTALDLDTYGRLWVGTDRGTLRFSQGAWTRYGYRKMTATDATTAQTVAEQLLGKRATPERVTNLASLIIDYNGLETDGRIEPGRVIYVYRNPAAAYVYDIASSGDRVLIASAAGQLEVQSGDWQRYYHGDLEREVVHAIATSERDIYFIADQRAVLYQKSRAEATFMYSPWLPELSTDLYYTYAAYVNKVGGLGTVGLAVTYLSYGEIQRTDEFGKAGLNFNAFDLAVSTSYGTRLGERLAGGLSAKVIYSRLSDQGAGQERGSGSATAIALDAGLLYQTAWKPLRLGAALTNLGPDISYIDAQQSDPLPRNLAVGFALQAYSSPYITWLLAGDVNRELVDLSDADNELKQNIYNVGTELTYLATLAGRLGYFYDEDGNIKELTVGGGVRLSSFQLDFSYIPSLREGSPLANTVRWSFTGRF